MRPLFTEEELEEMRRADEEIEREFRISRAERDRQDRDDRLSKIENSYGAAAYQREYYEANREAIAAKKREYYEANREALAAKKREYREANREALAAYQREYYEANMNKCVPWPEIVRDIREKFSMTQREMAQILGVSKSLVSHFETNRVPVRVDLYRAAGFDI